MVSAIFFDEPSQLSTAVVSFLTSASLAFIIARNPDIAVFPTNASAVCAFSESVSFANAALHSVRMSERFLIEPSAFVV